MEPNQTPDQTPESVRAQLTPDADPTASHDFLIPTEPDSDAPDDLDLTGRWAWTYAKHGWPTLLLYGIVLGDGNGEANHCDCPDGHVCDSPGKHPFSEGVWAPKNGLHGATTELDKVTDWWRRMAVLGRPTNVGVRPDPPYADLDIDDTDHPFYLLAMASDNPYQTTQRPEGGVTVFVSGVEGKSENLNGATVKGNGGGYSVMAPSMGVSGRRYEVKRGGIPHGISKAARQVLGEAKPRPAPEGVPAPLIRTHACDGCAKALDGIIPKDARYNTLLAYKAHLKRTHDLTAPDQFLPLMESCFANFDQRDGKYATPEAKAVLFKRVIDYDATHGYRIDGHHAEFDAAAATAMLDAMTIVPARDEPPATIDDWLIAGPDDDAGILTPGEWTLFTSPVGMGKSYMRLEMSLRLALGRGSFLSMFPIRRQSRVLLIDEDNGARVEWKRLLKVAEALGETKASLGENYRFLSRSGANLRTDAGRQFIELAVKHHGAETVILDTGALMVGEEWGAELNEAVHFLKTLADHESVALFTTSHFVKSSRNPRTNDRFFNHLSLDDVMGHWARAAGIVLLASPDSRAKTSGWLDIEKRGHVGSYLIERKAHLWVARAAPLVHTATHTGATTSGAETDDNRVLQALFNGFSMRSVVSGGDYDRCRDRLLDGGFIEMVNRRWVLTDEGRSRLAETGTEPEQEPEQEGLFERG